MLQHQLVAQRPPRIEHLVRVSVVRREVQRHAEALRQERRRVGGRLHRQRPCLPLLLRRLYVELHHRPEANLREVFRVAERPQSAVVLDRLVADGVPVRQFLQPDRQRRVCATPGWLVRDCASTAQRRNLCKCGGLSHSRWRGRRAGPTTQSRPRHPAASPAPAPPSCTCCGRSRSSAPSCQRQPCHSRRNHLRTEMAIEPYF